MSGAKLSERMRESERQRGPWGFVRENWAAVLAAVERGEAAEDSITELAARVDSEKDRQLTERDATIATLRADLFKADDRAETAENQCSSLVSARDLTIRDLRARLKAAERVVKAARGLWRELDPVVMNEPYTIVMERRTHDLEGELCAYDAACAKEGTS
jgi:predicted RNase H-like nuclease (RuvC/YqgF family)